MIAKIRLWTRHGKKNKSGILADLITVRSIEGFLVPQEDMIMMTH